MLAVTRHSAQLSQEVEQPLLTVLEKCLGAVAEGRTLIILSLAMVHRVKSGTAGGSTRRFRTYTSGAKKSKPSTLEVRKSPLFIVAISSFMGRHRWTRRHYLKQWVGH